MTVKSTEELFEQFHYKEPIGGGIYIRWIDQNLFTSALAEHDKEIINLVDEMIIKNKNLFVKRNQEGNRSPKSLEKLKGKYIALEELKELLKHK